MRFRHVLIRGADYQAKLRAANASQYEQVSDGSSGSSRLCLARSLDTVHAGVLADLRFLFRTI